MDCVKKLIKSGFKSMDCKQKPFEDYQDEIFAQMKHRVFAAGGCKAWYTNNKGVNWTLWPGDLIQYWLKTKSCDLNDYELQ